MTSGDRFELAAGVEQLEAQAWAQLNGLAPPDWRERFGIAVHRVGSATCIVAAHSKFVAVNRVIGLGCPQPASEDELDEVLALYRAAGVGKCLIHLSPLAVPTEVQRWIAARGGSTVAPTVKLVRRLAGDETRSGAPLDIRAVHPDETQPFVDIVAPRLGVPEGLEWGISSTIGRPGWRYYFVLDNATPIAAGASLVRGDHVWLGLAATRESHRNRGAQSLLLAKRLEDAARAGCRWASADTSAPTAEKPNQSLDNMLRLGFEVLYDRVNIVVPL